MAPAVLVKSASEEKPVTLDPQIVERFGMIYGKQFRYPLIQSVLIIFIKDGDLSITISMVIFIGLAVLAIFWARMYPDNRRNPNKEFVVFLLDPKSNTRGARTGQAGQETGSPVPPDDNNNPLQNGN